MKRILGSLLLLLTSLLGASQYVEYDIKANKHTVIANEAVYVVFQTRQKLHNEVMFFDLESIVSDAYDVVLIQKKRFEYNYHDAKKKFEYLVFPKKTGKVTVKFHFSIRRATDDAVAQTYVGSRDNVKYIPTTKVDIGDVVVTLDVKEVERKVDAVGNFAITMEIDKKSASSFDVVNVIYRIRGEGYLHERYEPLGELEGVSVFRGRKEFQKRPTERGYVYDREYTYALIASKSFLLPRASLVVCNTQTRLIETKFTPKQEITITQPDIASLVDKEELPKKQPNYFYLYFVNSLYYFVAFLVGFFIREVYERFLKKEDQGSKTRCCSEIKSTNSPQELLRLTMGLRLKYDLDTEIEKLEALVYDHDKTVSFERLKKEIIKKID